MCEGFKVKVLNAAGGADTATIIAGIYYAVDNGAQVINASLQRLNTHLDSLKEAIEYANSQNVVFISASGNDTLDLSIEGNDIFPGEIDSPNVINIAATNSSNRLASYSNFGKAEVDVAAPGGDQFEPIYSLATMNAHDNEFVGSGGTSMAAPIVAGVAALLIEADPSLTPTEVRKILMTSGSDIEELADVVGSGKLLDAQKALEATVAHATTNTIL